MGYGLEHQKNGAYVLTLLPGRCYAFSSVVTTFFIAMCFLLFDLPMLFFVVDILFLVCLHESSQLYTAVFY